MIDRATVIQRVSSYLTDDEPGYEFIHWTEEDLTTYFDLSLRILAVALPELSRGTCKAFSDGGSVVELPECCENLLSVIDVRVNGELQNARPRRVTVKSTHFASCPDRPGKYRLDSWSYDPEEGGPIYLTPPVPEGTPVEITLQCVKHLDVINGEVDIPAKYEPIIFELMLYYAWGVDLESPASRDRSALHYKNATDMLGAAANLKTLTAFTKIPEALVRARR